jgi:hypothetical protein
MQILVTGGLELSIFPTIIAPWSNSSLSPALTFSFSNLNLSEVNEINNYQIEPPKTPAAEKHS